MKGGLNVSQKSKLTIDDVKIMDSNYGCELLSDYLVGYY